MDKQFGYKYNFKRSFYVRTKTWQCLLFIENNQQCGGVNEPAQSQVTALITKFITLL